jgi:hypothetical protein
VEQPAVSPSGASRQIRIAASASTVWSLVSDVERFGEWSPETYRVEWVTPPPQGVGSRFRGYNHNLDKTKSWWSECEVLQMDREHVFCFSVLCVDFGDGNVIDLRGDGSTTWRYAIDKTNAAEGEVTLVLGFDCPSFSDPHSDYRRAGRFEDLESGCEQTLQQLKRAAEQR